MTLTGKASVWRYSNAFPLGSFPSGHLFPGPLIRFLDEPPPFQAIATDFEAMPLLSAYILRRSAGTFRVSSQAQQSRVHLHFDH